MDNDDNENNENNEALREELGGLVREMTEKVEAVGLYPAPHPISAGVGADGSPILNMRFVIGEVAYTPRVQTPEMFDLDVQFQAAMPSETELEAIRIRSLMEENGDV
jgi:hypothetical protein